MDSSLEKQLKKELTLHARALSLPEGSAEIFIDKTLSSIRKSLKNKSLITTNDLANLIVKELKKYNSDLAYVYQNRDKII